MKQLLTVLTALSITSAFGQQLISGTYNSSLRLAFDDSTKKVTGYFEDYTGWDESIKKPRFSCIFYFEGMVNGKIVNIKSYYPTNNKNDTIEGIIKIVADKKVKIKLSKEHDGCQNVQHFADEETEFTLEKSEKWLQARYVEAAKAYFFDDKSDNKQSKSYLLKGDFVCVEKIEQGWAYCTYFGKKITKGWLKLSVLNTQ